MGNDMATVASNDQARALDRTLYRYSGMVDLIRDSARELLEHAVADPTQTAAAVRELASQYSRLRTAIATALPADEAAGLGEWTRELDPAATAAEVYEAAATLARFVDLFFGVDAFVASRSQTRQEIARVLAASPDADDTDEPGTPARAAGQYL